MNTPGLLAAMLAVAPLGAAAQQEQARPAPSQPGCAGADDGARASGALPARASVKPAPQQGTVVPANRVLSYTVTPSLRAMRAVREKEAARAPDTPPDAGPDCVPRTGQSDREKS